MGMVHPLVLADKDRHVMYMYMFVNDWEFASKINIKQNSVFFISWGQALKQESDPDCTIQSLTKKVCE